MADLLARAKRTHEILMERTARSVELLLRADEDTEPQRKVRAAYEMAVQAPYEQQPAARAAFEQQYPGQWQKQAYLELRRNEREAQRMREQG